MPNLQQRYLRPDELAERWGVNVKTLANWRTAGVGLSYVKIGGLVRYSITDVETYEEKNREMAHSAV